MKFLFSSNQERGPSLYSQLFLISYTIDDNEDLLHHPQLSRNQNAVDTIMETSDLAKRTAQWINTIWNESQHQPNSFKSFSGPSNRLYPNKKE